MQKVVHTSVGHKLTSRERSRNRAREDCPLSEHQSMLQEPFLQSARPTHKPRRHCRVAAAVAVSAAGIACIAVSQRFMLSGVRKNDTTLTAPPTASSVLILGDGGAVWANGSKALGSHGVLTWACRLSPSQLHSSGGGAVALVEEDTATVLAWHPHGTTRRLPLTQLRRPVACRQIGTLLYVACFGIEGEPGRAGIAVIDAGAWTIVRERVIGTHVHNIYPAPGAPGRLFYTDLGDPWISPPALGGLFHIDWQLEGQPARIGPPCHARAASIPHNLLDVVVPAVDGPN